MRAPREALMEFIGVPDDIEVSVYTDNGLTWFKASIPKLSTINEGSLGHMRLSNERIKNCPVLGVSGSDFIRDHVKILSQYGINVPGDVIVEIEEPIDGFIHFSVCLDRL